MKRYLIFGGPCFYARGGFKDLIGDADTPEQGRALANGVMVETEDSIDGVEWWQVVDLHTGEIVVQSDLVALGAKTEQANDYNLIFLSGHLIPEAVEVPE